MSVRPPAAAGGLRGYEPAEPHVAVSPGREVTRLPGLTVHRSAIPPADALPSARPPRTRMARSLVDAARWAADDDRACAVLAAGVQQRLVRPDQLARALSALPKARRRRLLLATIRDLAGGAHSLAELDLVRLCRRHRLPPPVQQVHRRDASGRRRWLDAVWPEWGVHVEVDGGAHTEVRGWWADMRRQNEIWVRGERVLRFPAHALRTDPTTIATQLRAALRMSGWRSGSVGVPVVPTTGTPTEPG